MNILTRVTLVVLLSLIAGGFPAFGSSDSPPALATSLTVAAPQDDLQQIQDRLDLLKQQVAVATDYGQWVVLKDFVQKLSIDADLMMTSRLPERTQVLARLDVLGPVPAAGAATETSAVAQQRVALLARKSQLESELKQLAVIKENATKLTIQIAEIRRTQLESQLTLLSDSVLNPRFWSPLFYPPAEDRQRLSVLTGQVALALETAWLPEQRTTTLTLLLFALGLCTLVRPVAEKVLARYCMPRLPEGRLRRTTLAMTTAVGTLLTVGGAFELVLLIFTQQPQLAPSLANFLDEFETLVLTCVLMLGLTRALLSTDRPLLAFARVG